MLMLNYIKHNNFKGHTNNSVYSLLYSLNFHTSTSAYSDKINQTLVDRTLNASNERLSNLQLIKYKENVVESEIPNSDDSVSSYDSNFPWLMDENNQILDYNKQIDVFKGVKMISYYLEKRFDLDKDQISNVKISELLEPFKDNNNVTVLELFNHFGNIYNNNKDSLIKDLIQDTTKSLTLNKMSSVENASMSTLKPLGTFGDTTLNEVSVSLLNLRWDLILNNAKLTIHAAPLAMNLLSYTFFIKGYMKYVHNRPYDFGPYAASLPKQQRQRNIRLAIFSLVGAPLTLCFIKASSALSIRNIFDLSISGSAPELPNNNTPLINNTGFLLLLSKLNNKIPSWVKLAFKLLFFIIILLKLLGYSIITDVFNDLYFLKKLVYIGSSLVILFDVLNLYLIHKFANKKVKIPAVLPDFIINWLTDFEELSSTQRSIKVFKKECYINISIYLVIMILITLI